MYRLSPSMTQPPASFPLHSARPGRGGQPARVGSGVRLGQRERRDHLAGGQLGQPLLALLRGARRDQHLPGDPVVRAEQRAERGAGVAELDGHPDLLGDRQAEPAVLGGQRVAVQAHLLGLRDQPGRDLIGLVDAGLGRQHLAPDEPAQQAEQLVEVGLVHHAPSVTSLGPAGKPVRRQVILSEHTEVSAILVREPASSGVRGWMRGEPGFVQSCWVLCASRLGDSDLGEEVQDNGCRQLPGDHAPGCAGDHGARGNRRGQR